jgi:uncharacterized protein
VSVLGDLAIIAAGFGAGVVNTVVGSGTLITFPTLVALGLPPVVANVTNTVGLVPGTLSGVVGYRRELVGQAERIVCLGLVAAAGSTTGALLLLVAPGAFTQVVPILLLMACALVAVQPRLARRFARSHDAPPSSGHTAALMVGVFLTTIYGGYFGAAQGIFLMGLMGALLADDLQRINALKNVLALIVNLVAAVIFAFSRHIDWQAAGLIAVGGVVGAQVGATLGRKLRPAWLRALIVIVGVTVALHLLAA